jgi:3alpha(or 20beta)-hydroxysteroid dehydrogenase
MNSFVSTLPEFPSDEGLGYSPGLLRGRVAIVTGAARGMGASHALHLARAGARVVLGDVLDDAGEEMTAKLSSEGLDVRFVHLDVTDPRSWDDAVRIATDDGARLAVLVNNAGTGGPSGVADCPDDEWDRIISVNQTGVFNGIRAVVPSMRRGGGGSIINVSSQWGHIGGSPGHVAYVASKWAVRGLTRSAAVTLAPDGIRVNGLSPGMVRTAMLGDPSHVSVEMERSPLKRAGEVFEVSPAVVYLASDLSSYVTGIDLPVEGGLEAS